MNKKRVIWLTGGIVAAVLVGFGVTWASGGQAQPAAEQESPTASPTPSATEPSPTEPEPEPAPTDAEPAAPTPTPTAVAPEPAPTTVVNGVVLPEESVVPPVEFDEPAEITPDFTATVTAIRAIDGVAQGIGEIGGPALAFDVSLTNNTSAPLETVGVVVNCYDGTTAPAIPLQGDPNDNPLPDTIAPGATATGTYVFNVPMDARNIVTLTLSFDPESPTVVFSGALPK